MMNFVFDLQRFNEMDLAEFIKEDSNWSGNTKYINDNGAVDNNNTTDASYILTRISKGDSGYTYNLVSTDNASSYMKIDVQGVTDLEIDASKGPKENCVTLTIDKSTVITKAVWGYKFKVTSPQSDSTISPKTYVDIAYDGVLSVANEVVTLQSAEDISGNLADGVRIDSKDSGVSFWDGESKVTFSD